MSADVTPERGGSLARLWLPDRLADKLTSHDAISYPLAGACDLLADEANIRWRVGDYHDAPETLFGALSPDAALVHASATVAAAADRDADRAVGVLEGMYDDFTVEDDPMRTCLRHIVSDAEQAARDADGPPHERVKAGRRVFADAVADFHDDVERALAGESRPPDATPLDALITTGEWSDHPDAPDHPDDSGGDGQ